MKSYIIYQIFSSAVINVTTEASLEGDFDDSISWHLLVTTGHKSVLDRSCLNLIQRELI